MANERAAIRLGIRHERIFLEHDAEKRIWRNPKNLNWEGVESASLGWFVDRGWSGFAGEGGLILNLIKAMSFEKIAPRHCNTYIEALYAQNVAFEEDRFETKVLLRNLRSATPRRVIRNFNRMVGWDPVRLRFGTKLAFFPNVKRSHVFGLMCALGTEAIFEVAEIFARDPYEYRKGWPDLTLWRGTEVAFKEIKAPGDALRTSQRKIIREVLVPLKLDVSVVDVGACQAR